MSLAAISPVSSLVSSVLPRTIGRIGALGRAEALRPIESLSRAPGREYGLEREESEKVEAGISGREAFSARRPGVDPRKAEWIVGPVAGESPARDGALSELEGRRASETRSGSSGASERAGEAERARARARRGPEASLSEGELNRRLAELQGERSREERKRADSQGTRSAETTAMLSKLRVRDSEVRAHESAHKAAGGRYVTGGASFTYQKGPDGHNYAVGGEVGIDTAPLPGKPAETAAKMRTVRAAALAPAEPSGADLSVASAAARAEAQAMAELAASRREEASASALNAAAPGGAAISWSEAEVEKGAASRRGEELVAASYRAGSEDGTRENSLDMLA